MPKSQDKLLINEEKYKQYLSKIMISDDVIIDLHESFIDIAILAEKYGINSLNMHTDNDKFRSFISKIDMFSKTLIEKIPESKEYVEEAKDNLIKNLQQDISPRGFWENLKKFAQTIKSLFKAGTRKEQQKKRIDNIFKEFEKRVDSACNKITQENCQKYIENIYKKFQNPLMPKYKRSFEEFEKDAKKIFDDELDKVGNSLPATKCKDLKAFNNLFLSSVKTAVQNDDDTTIKQSKFPKIFDALSQWKNFTSSINKNISSTSKNTRNDIKSNTQLISNKPVSKERRV